MLVIIELVARWLFQNFKESTPSWSSLSSFTIVVEGLNRLFQKEMDGGMLKDFNVTFKEIKLSYLHFANDTNIFYKAYTAQEKILLAM